MGFDQVTGLLPSTAYVVASNAPTSIKAQAQILKSVFGDLVQICDGVADNVEIQAAIDALPAGGGTIQLSEGTFTLATKVNMKSNVCLKGQGSSTVLVNGGATHSLNFEGTQTAGTSLTADTVVGETHIHVADSSMVVAGDMVAFSTAEYYDLIEVASTAVGIIYLRSVISDVLLSGITASTFRPIANVRVSNIRFNGGSGLYFYKVNHIEIDHNYFEGVSVPINSNTGAYIRAVNVHHNIFTNSGGAGTIVLSNYGSDLVAQDNLLLGGAGFGVLINQVRNIDISRNIIRGQADIPIYARKVYNINIESNQVNAATSDGIVAEAISDADNWASRKVRIVNNTLDYILGGGIIIKMRGVITDEKRPRDFVVSGNILRNIVENAISIYGAWDGVVSNNMIDTIVGAATNAIQIEGDCKRITIMGNNVKGATGYDLYIYHGVSPATDIVVIGNYFSGSGLGYVDVGALPIIRNNAGYVTENSGIATILANTLFVDATHSLSITPDINKIALIPKDNIGARSLYVNDVGALTFRINLSLVDAAVAHVIGWSYTN